MKNKFTLSVIFFLLLSNYLFAQHREEKEQPKSEYSPSDAYISVGSGINYNTGLLGVQFEKKFADKFSGYIGAGFGTWGDKITVGGRYYFGEALTSAFSFSYTYVTGSKNVKANLYAVDSTNLSSQQGKQVTMTYDLNPVSTINFSWLKYWKMGKRSRFNIELGWSFLLNTVGDNYKVNDPVGIKLTDASKAAFNILQPGGLMVGIGFSFGL